jgi:DNA topoisomerase-1
MKDAKPSPRPGRPARSGGVGRPGLRQRRGPRHPARAQGRRLRVLQANGDPVTDEATLERIRKLAIPPAYEDVWICPKANGHLQATGRDARGRKQYRYHPQFREVRESTKYEHMMEFARALPAVRGKLAEHMALRGLPREKVLATVVHLLETTLIRVGNDDYARRTRATA